MAHRNWMLIVNDNKNNRKRIFEFTSKLDYENQLNKVKQDFTIIQENTITTLDVELAPTIFDEGADVNGSREGYKIVDGKIPDYVYLPRIDMGGTGSDS